MCLDRRDVSLDAHSVRLPTSHLPSQPGLPQPQERLHDLKGISVWEFITMRPSLYRSHLFLPLWHWENCFQSLEGSLAFRHPIHHESSLQRMDHFHAYSLPCLSVAFIGRRLPPCTIAASLCLLQLPSAQAYITGDTGGQSFLFWHYRNWLWWLVASKCSFRAMFLYKAPHLTSREWRVKWSKICDQTPWTH